MLIVMLGKQPTLQFFQSGKKAGEIIGADVAGIKNMMEKLYKWADVFCFIPFQSRSTIWHVGSGTSPTPNYEI